MPAELFVENNYRGTEFQLIIDGLITPSNFGEIDLTITTWYVVTETSGAKKYWAID